MAVYMRWRNPSEVLKALKEVGVKASYIREENKLIIRGRIHRADLGMFQSVQIYQDNIEITFSDFKKTLRIINDDNGKLLYIYLPKKSMAGYYKNYLWVLIA
jgi:hypothetical protein